MTVSCSVRFLESSLTHLPALLPPSLEKPEQPISLSQDTPPYLLSLGALRTLHLQLRERLHSQLLSSYVRNLGGEDGYTQSGGFAGIDERDVELMRVYYAKNTYRRDNDSKSSDDDEDNDEFGDGPWDVGVCKVWLAEVVGKWVDLPGVFSFSFAIY